MSIALAFPSENLAPFVKSYWGLNMNLSAAGGREHVQRIVPNALPELTFHLGDLPEKVQSGEELPSPSLLSGQQKGYFDLRSKGDVSLFSIIFQPHGLGAFFDQAPELFSNQSIALEDLLPEEARRLEDALFEASESGTGAFELQVNLVEAFLLDRLKKVKELFDFRRMQHCLALINRRGGSVPVEHLAHETCLGRKQFERSFRSWVGDSPKQFLRKVRFQRALRDFTLYPEDSLTALAHRCGYFDQAHMIRDFVNMSGLTPRQYFAQGEIYSDYFS